MFYAETAITEPEYAIWSSEVIYFDRCQLLTRLSITCCDEEVKALMASLSTVAAYQLRILEIQIKVNILILPDYEWHGNMLHRFSHLLFNSANHNGFKWLDVQLGYASIPSHIDRAAALKFVRSCLRKLHSLPSTRFSGINWKVF